MKNRPQSQVDTAKIDTPAFVIEEHILRHNLSILKEVKEKTGTKMLQALKTWATWELFPIVREYLDGAEVSSLNEATLGAEYYDEVHIYAPAYREKEFEEILEKCTTIIFNSFLQWKKFKPQVEEWNAQNPQKKRECGLRINPGDIEGGSHSGLWSPTSPGSRLGIRVSEFETALKEDPKALEGISGLHFHVFWDEALPQLKNAVAAVEQKFGKYLPQMKWVNWGGGQTITNDDYDREGLVELINAFQKKHGVTVHLEPGAAIVKDAGALVATVLDMVHRDDVPFEIAVLDMSFNAHMPDFLLSPDLDMPVARAAVVREEGVADQPNLYQLAGGTCVTGDHLSHYHSFERSLMPGDKIMLLDGIQYNLVQCTMFNGVQHPSIVLLKQNGEYEVLREFGYEDYKNRMG
ncbi:MAG: carboxynorspermidine decarboxylase [Patescibacteria group bacterium]|nr:carboxynorspermidine decarboxylase [Patescibacteria group bacterium]